jgi:hypothetical protein
MVGCRVPVWQFARLYYGDAWTVARQVSVEFIKRSLFIDHDDAQLLKFAEHGEKCAKGLNVQELQQALIRDGNANVIHRHLGAGCQALTIAVLPKMSDWQVDGVHSCAGSV